MGRVYTCSRISIHSWSLPGRQATVDATYFPRFAITMKTIHAASILVWVSRVFGHGYIWSVTADNTV